ncbi:NADP-dependent oxidoreductase [Paenibacillus rhizophilus]
MTIKGDMKAVRIHEYGGTEVIRYEVTPIPEIDQDEVLIKVAATAFNPVDAAIRMGALKNIFPHRMPYIPNVEASGVIESIGGAVTNFKPGDPVFVFLDMTKDGAAAEYVVTKTENAALAPKSIDLQDAGAIPVGALTAWQGLFDHGKLQEGQRVLITAAAGGVGSYAVQLAKWKGAHVIGTASEASFPLLQGLGIDQIIDYKHEAVEEKVSDKLDLILNLAPEGPAELNKWLPLLKEGGIFVSTTSPADAELANRSGVQTIRMYVGRNAGQLSQIAALVDEGRIKPVITERVKLDDLALIHNKSQAGKIRGKVLINLDWRQ